MLGERLEINLQLLKDLVGLNVFDSDKDVVLTHYLNKAEQSILNYLHYTVEEMGVLFDTQLVDLAKYYFFNRMDTGVSQKSQGSRSISYEKGIPLEIRDALPMPRVRVVG